ncbi:MAG: PepSY domain-containing protein [Pseudomonadota bacterium]
MRMRQLFVLHRSLGVAVAVLLLLLVGTGVLLNHTEELALDERHVQHPGLLHWYGIAAPPAPPAYPVASGWIAPLNGAVYFNGAKIADNAALVGAVQSGDIIITALPDRLLLLTPAGELIDVILAGMGFAGQISAVGLDEGRVVVRSEQGTFGADSQFMTWNPIGAASAAWAEPVPLPAAQLAQLAQSDSAISITLERLLLDLHSGRFFGPWGVILMDLAGLALLLLAGSGVFLWARIQWRKRR